MSDEIRLKTVPGTSNVKALIVGTDGTVWNGTSMVAISTLTDANWTSSLIACAEKQTSDGTDTGIFTVDWPASLTQSAIYDVIFYSGASPVPDDSHIGVQHDPTEYLSTRQVVVNSFTQNALSEFATDDTGESTTAVRSVSRLSQAASQVVGGGAVETNIITNDDEGNPLDGVEVWATTDAAGNNVVAGTLSSDTDGTVTFMLDAGTYYIWRQLARFNFPNPQTIVVS